MVFYSITHSEALGTCETERILLSFEKNNLIITLIAFQVQFQVAKIWSVLRIILIMLI